MNQTDSSSERHTETWDQLPWYANSSLSDVDRRRVESHLESCDECARELSFLSGLSDSICADEALLVTPERSLTALTRRIDALEAARQDRLDWGDVARIVRAKLVRGGVLGLRPALATLAVLLIAASVWLASSLAGPDFRTLSTAGTEPVAENARIRLVFEGTATVDEIQELLVGIGVDLIAGPSPYGVYTARVGPTGDAVEIGTVLAELRRHPLVSFAELIPGPARSAP